MIIPALLAAAAAPAFAQAQGPTQPAAQQQAQPMTKASLTQNLDKSFTEVDSNKDGFIDAAEIRAQDARNVANVKAALLKESQSAFQKLDVDKNGSLSLQEFNAIAASRQIRTGDPAKIVAALDSNKDGKVSKLENRAPRLAQFDQFDANKDGTLSVAEQQAAARRR